jgi:hypothetical protein
VAVSFAFSLNSLNERGRNLNIWSGHVAVNSPGDLCFVLILPLAAQDHGTGPVQAFASHIPERLARRSALFLAAMAFFFLRTLGFS